MYSIITDHRMHLNLIGIKWNKVEILHVERNFNKKLISEIEADFLVISNDKKISFNLRTDTVCLDHTYSLILNNI